jgi:hypothetical protein
MKKIFISVILLLITMISFGQNTPPNQPAVTSTNTSSQPVEFKNMRTFITNGTLQLPPGTNRIMVEVWGGGGGGSNTGGGGGGAYGKATLAVGDGSAVTVYIGAGGKGGTLQASNGATTSIQYRPQSNPASAYVFAATGGAGAGYIVGMGGAADQGNGGAAAYSTGSGVGYYSMCGQDGQTYTDEYQQSGTNTFVVTRSIGGGGNAGNTQYTGGRGDVVVNPASPGYKRYGTEGKIPGGGGGGSINQLGGYKGGNGMVIVYY